LQNVDVGTVKEKDPVGFAISRSPLTTAIRGLAAAAPASVTGCEKPAHGTVNTFLLAVGSAVVQQQVKAFIAAGHTLEEAKVYLNADLIPQMEEWRQAQLDWILRAVNGADASTLN